MNTDERKYREVFLSVFICVHLWFHFCTCAYVASSALALCTIADSSRGQSSISWRDTTPRRSISVGTLVTVWRMPYSPFSWLLIGRSLGWFNAIGWITSAIVRPTAQPAPPLSLIASA